MREPRDPSDLEERLTLITMFIVIWCLFGLGFFILLRAVL